jgi:hypothetical protein
VSIAPQVQCAIGAIEDDAHLAIGGPGGWQHEGSGVAAGRVGVGDPGWLAGKWIFDVAVNGGVKTLQLLVAWNTQDAGIGQLLL